MIEQNDKVEHSREYRVRLIIIIYVYSIIIRRVITYQRLIQSQTHTHTLTHSRRRHTVYGRRDETRKKFRVVRNVLMICDVVMFWCLLSRVSVHSNLFLYAFLFDCMQTSDCQSFLRCTHSNRIRKIKWKEKKKKQKQKQIKCKLLSYSKVMRSITFLRVFLHFTYW